LPFYIRTGVQHVANVEDFPDDKWDFLLNVNLTSNFHTIKEALPRMKEVGYGRIINISSAHGKVASVGKVRVALASFMHGT
jgi:3-hydroxybutyrate dehydrogenase